MTDHSEGPLSAAVLDALEKYVTSAPSDFFVSHQGDARESATISRASLLVLIGEARKGLKGVLAVQAALATALLAFAFFFVMNA